jgi:hypothetical protein
VQIRSIKRTRPANFRVTPSRLSTRRRGNTSQHRGDTSWRSRESSAIIRARATRRLTPAEERAAIRGLQIFARRCYVVAVTDAVLARVGRPFPVEPIRTLDAVHLATAEELGEAPQLVTIVTRDARVSDNARTLGYGVE